MNEYICTKKIYKNHFLEAWYKSNLFKLSLIAGALFIIGGFCLCMATDDITHFLLNSIWVFGGIYIAFGRGFIRANSAYKYQTKMHLMENWKNKAIFEDDKIVFKSEVRGKEEKDWVTVPILYKDIKSVIVKENTITITVKVGVTMHLYKDCFVQMTYDDFCKIIKDKCECEIIEK